jgi:hypothetical protein
VAFGQLTPKDTAFYRERRSPTARRDVVSTGAGCDGGRLRVSQRGGGVFVEFDGKWPANCVVRQQMLGSYTRGELSGQTGNRCRQFQCGGAGGSGSAGGITVYSTRHSIMPSWPST